MEDSQSLGSGKILAGSMVVDDKDKHMGPGRNEWSYLICRVNFIGFLRLSDWWNSPFERERLIEERRRLKEAQRLLEVNKLRRKNQRDEVLKRIIEAVKQRVRRKEISVVIQRLSLAVNKLRRKNQRDKAPKRIREDENPEKCNCSNRSGHLKHYQQQQGQLYQQEKHEQHDQDSKQGQQDQQPMQRQQIQKQTQKQQNLQRRGQKNQLKGGQQDRQLNKGQQGHEERRQQRKYVPVSHDANSKGYSVFARKERLKTEQWTSFLRLMVMLMLSGCPVSGLCSTCLGERCYDNGECIIGCQHGYVGKYCSEACPPGCVNNECYIDIIKGTISCISGCEAGYCGAKCSLRCPESCLTCDRQCDSCNMTLCPERRFGVGCSEICSLRYEKCDRENGQCIRCRRGYYGDECDMECLTCFTRENDISDKCLSGCEKCQTQETCTAEFYGEKCEHRCSSGCKQSDGACNRATGECSDGCVSGYHGLTCNYSCNKFCVGGFCNQHNGVCTSGCVSGYSQGPQGCVEVQETGVKVVPVSNTVLLILISCVAVSVLILSCLFIVYVRRLSRRSMQSWETRNAEREGRFLRCGDINHSMDL